MEFDFIAIDFEIANSNYSSACSLGLVGVKDNDIVEEKYYLIKPLGMNFGETEMEIHAITPETVANSPSFPELWHEISHYFNGNSIIIAHNAVFDMSVLKNCLMEYNLEIPDFNYICSIPISTRACRGKNVGKSLKDRCNYFEIEMGQHHNSLDDAKACANLVIKCLKLKKRKSITSYCSTFSSIPIKVFKDLNPLREFRKNKTYNNSNLPSNKFNQISISEITATMETIDTSNDFYNKNLVFTGELKNMDRKQAMQSVVNLGGMLKNGVSSKIDYLVVGAQDESITKDGISTKEKKAYELIEKGYNIKILNESQFLSIIHHDKNENLKIESMINFNTINEKLEKLKEWKLLSPKAEEIKALYYKNNDNMYECNILGFLSKETNSNCLSEYYETVVIKADNKVVKISPSYLLEMQKKNFSTASIIDGLEAENE